MLKSQAETTKAENLEDKFDRGEDVLDYFDVGEAWLIKPQSKLSGAKPKSGYQVTRTSARRAIVREKSARYRKKK